LEGYDFLQVNLQSYQVLHLLKFSLAFLLEALSHFNVVEVMLVSV
jgi:hypothetical protein